MGFVRGCSMGGCFCCLGKICLGGVGLIEKLLDKQNVRRIQITSRMEVGTNNISSQSNN
jgi:hypothetical protein